MVSVIELEQGTLNRLVDAYEAHQLRALAAWLIDAAEQLERLNRPGREIVERRTDHARRITYQLERVRCGKATCRCARGAGHGPYWYAYWSEGGKTKSKYIGKLLPDQKTGAA